MLDALQWRVLAGFSRSPRATLALGLWFGILYLGTAQHGQVSADVSATYLPAWALGQRHSPNVDGFQNMTMWLREVGGHWRSDRYPGAILPSVPAYLWFGSPHGPTIGPSLVTAAVMTAITVVLIHRTLLRITGPGLAFAGALVFGLGTPTWTVSADAMWTHTSTQLGLALALYGLAASRPWLGGLGMVLSASARPHTAVAAAVLGLGDFVRTRKVTPMLWLAAGSLGGFAVVLWWSGWTLGHAALLPGSYAGRGGTALTAGRTGEGSSDLLGWPVNLAGFLISPERGLLVMCPFVIPCVVGMRRAWRTAPGFARDGAIAAVVYTVVQLAANGFGGGWGFYSFRHGLEGLTLATPMLVLGAAAVCRSRRWAWVLAVLVGYSVAVHTLGGVWYVAYNEGPVWWTKYQPAEIFFDAKWFAVVSALIGVAVAIVCAALVRSDAREVVDVTGGPDEIDLRDEDRDSHKVRVGRTSIMEPSEDAVHARSNLLPEELAHGGSDDPEAQAEAILQDSEERVDEPTAAPDPDDARPSHDDEYEHRRAEDIV